MARVFAHELRPEALADNRRAYDHYARRRPVVQGIEPEPSRESVVAAVQEIVLRMPATSRAAVRAEVLGIRGIAADRIAAITRDAGDEIPERHKIAPLARDARERVAAGLVQKFGRMPAFRWRWVGQF